MYVLTISVRNCQKFQRRIVIHAAYPIITQELRQRIERVMVPVQTNRNGKH